MGFECQLIMQSLEHYSDLLSAGKDNLGLRNGVFFDGHFIGNPSDMKGWQP